MSRKTGHYEGALLEDILHRLKLVQESLSDLPVMREDLQDMKKRLHAMDDWSDIAKLVIKDQSKTLNNHERRLTKLETA